MEQWSDKSNDVNISQIRLGRETFNPILYRIIVYDNPQS